MRRGRVVQDAAAAPADVKRKNDLSDAQFLARLLATHNVTEVFVPDAETEAARDLVRAHADARADLTRARQRLNLFLMRHGHVFCEKGPTGAPVGSWTKAHWAWIRQISFPDEADEGALAFYIEQVRHMEGQKRSSKSSSAPTRASRAGAGGSMTCAA